MHPSRPRRRASRVSEAQQTSFGGRTGVKRDSRMSGIHTLTRTSERAANSPREQARSASPNGLDSGILSAGNAALTNLLSERDSGRPLDAATQRQMENAFG